jgi:broad specificity phosphatase PhoE
MFQGRHERSNPTSNSHSRVRSIHILLFATFLASSMKLARGFQVLVPVVSPHSRRLLSSIKNSIATNPLRGALYSSNADADLMDMSPTTDMIEGPTLPPQAATAKRFFFVRHGEVINPGGPDKAVYYGAMDVPLSPLGQQEAVAAGAYLRQFSLAHVFASPLSRAVYGANAVLEQQETEQKELILLQGFKELDRGAWCGKTTEEIGADVMERFNACDESITPDAGGESYPFLKQRVLQALEDALQQVQPGEAACVVSHLQVTRSILSQALQIPVEKMSGLKVATASITCIDYDDQVTPTVHFQSFKPNVGLEKAKDGAN